MNLFISTATNTINAVIYNDNEIIKSEKHLGHNDHTSTIYGIVKGLKIDYEKIKKIYIINGPGSFTGLRVGVVLAKTLAMEKKIDIYPVNLLELLEEQNDKKVAIDARGGKYFALDNKKIVIGEIKKDMILDPSINIKLINKSEYLKSIKPVNYLKLGIEYVKHPIT